MLKRGGNNNDNNRLKKTPLYHPPNGKKMQLQENQLQTSDKSMANRARSARERKIALLQDVDNLKKRLRHEENVHRALQRAFSRPLGSLPRLPPCLPQCILELLAEVAVLEEEVVRLEEQVATYRQGLYQEAVYTSSMKSHEGCPNKHSNNDSSATTKNSKQRHSRSLSQCEYSHLGSYERTEPSPSLARCSSSRKFMTINNLHDRVVRHYRETSTDGENLQIDLGLAPENRLGKENQSCINSCKNKTHGEEKPRKKYESTVKSVNIVDTQCRVLEQGHKSFSDDKIRNIDSEANKTSEDILKSLINIFMRLSSSRGKTLDSDSFSSLSAKGFFAKHNQGSDFRDPYCIFSEFKKRDVGTYKNLLKIKAHSVDFRRKMSSSFLIRRLKVLLEKLESMKIDGLSHQQKLAFWINIYNSCIMNAFLEHGIPDSPEMAVLQMQKATIKVGGHVLNALMIEHLILRLPYHLKYTCPKYAKNDEREVLGTLGLEWSEPLVTFALSCGSWSSPAVRVYTASRIESELETAKRDYLQASIGISAKNRIIIPKILDWYLLDFAKDLDSLLDWVCLQLSDDLLRNEVIKIIHGKGKQNVSDLVQVMPYNFSFRYLICR